LRNLATLGGAFQRDQNRTIPFGLIVPPSTVARMLRSDYSISSADSPWKVQCEWEDNNAGNYRRVYPVPEGQTDKYERFFHQNLSSLFQETAASRAREEASRQQRDLYEVSTLLFPTQH